MSYVDPKDGKTYYSFDGGRVIAHYQGVVPVNGFRVHLALLDLLEDALVHGDGLVDDLLGPDELAEPIIDEGTLMSYVNPDDGKTYYSFDGGKTFEPLTDEEFERRFPTPNVEWWTYEEYAAWPKRMLFYTS